MSGSDSINHSLQGMFGGNTVPNHLKMMPYTMVGHAPDWEVKCEICKPPLTCKYAVYQIQQLYFITV